MNIKSILHLLSFKLFKSNSFINNNIDVQNEVLTDISRNRKIPIVIYKNIQIENLPKRIAIINGGYGVAHTAYSYIANKLCNEAFLVVSIQHDLPEDTALALEGDLYELRMPVWQRGIENIKFITNYLQNQFSVNIIEKLVLIGHSNGGDISMLFAIKFPETVSHVISLDHLQVPVPSVSSPRILSFRANDSIAGKSIIPDIEEQEKFGIKIIHLQDAGHSDMKDDSSKTIKQKITDEIKKFIIL